MVKMIDLQQYAKKVQEMRKAQSEYHTANPNKISYMDFDRLFWEMIRLQHEVDALTEKALQPNKIPNSLT